MRCPACEDPTELHHVHDAAVVDSRLPMNSSTLLPATIRALRTNTTMDPLLRGHFLAICERLQTLAADVRTTQSPEMHQRVERQVNAMLEALYTMGVILEGACLTPPPVLAPAPQPPVEGDTTLAAV